ncbi:MAG: hypothetical protein DI556_02600 [Rhodovulum sulfidophilum]|uniref:SCP domain-containing protein n=1 Tax=Rhodovulum sulfidophilum TaxID=35806 RepID=A0A2W5NJ71_RHOSU|nr:MAG: hypothetical protein DI556_02600 [Rhodovulum sulfidophilum]
MIRSCLSALAILAAVTACAPTGTGGTPRISAAETNDILVRQLDAVNAVRETAGLVPLRYSAELNAAAATQARDMSVQGRAWHFGSDLTSPRERAFRAGYRAELVGENIAEGTDTDLAVLRSWLDFKDTRDIIMDPDGRGFGFAWYQEDSGKIWWVQLVGK